MEPWAAVLFRLLWLLLVVFLVWTGFTVYVIAYACIELYQLGLVLPFIPSIILGLVSLLSAGWALCMVARVVFWKIEALIYKWDMAFRQAELLKRQISLEDRKTA